MEITVAKSAGFCFGVKRAVDITEKALDKFEDVYSIGSIVHNKFVNKSLEEKGLKFLDNIKDVPSDTKVIIRAHGVTKEELELCKERNLEIIDTTCPNVKKIHDIVSKYSLDGYKLIIIGDKDHPEVKGTSGWVTGDYIVIKSAAELSNVSLDKVCVVSQTTMNIESNKAIVAEIKNKAKDCVIFDTVCRATEERQNELKQLATLADYVIVIGDKASANSNRLYEIAKNICNSQFIENIDELCLNFLESSCKIVVMAGASTPQCIIDQVVDKLKLN